MALLSVGLPPSFTRRSLPLPATSQFSMSTAFITPSACWRPTSTLLKDRYAAILGVLIRRS